ncbi:hypothetical protein KEM09_12075 [Carboxylicivirga mesophila]|uniref:Uncharacterized protein n=1 Tax=Carboxylicivirga mesophila TaxID=1166478 RepID=A0ABS5KB73_9BACT|nr:hypothetical protein [Carboxylicivirga mesophila]MBS2212147.1 hypothetical protein [Carboxylicivirga mesophila]
MYVANKIHFYANFQGMYINKLFTFEVNGMQACLRILKQFVERGNIIKAVYITAVNHETGEVINEKQSVEELMMRIF